MKKILLLTTFVFYNFSLCSQNGEGVRVRHEITNDTIKKISMYCAYLNQNLYMYNNIKSIDGFTVKEVSINKKVMQTNTDADAFEINLKNLNLTKGDVVLIEIKYTGIKKPSFVYREGESPIIKYL